MDKESGPEQGGTLSSPELQDYKVVAEDMQMTDQGDEGKALEDTVVLSLEDIVQPCY